MPIQKAYEKTVLAPEDELIIEQVQHVGTLSLWLWMLSPKVYGPVASFPAASAKASLLAASPFFQPKSVLVAWLSHIVLTIHRIIVLDLAVSRKYRQ